MRDVSLSERRTGAWAIKCKTNASNGCHSLLSTQAEDGTNEGVTPENSYDVLTSTGYYRVSFECSENNYTGDVPL